MMRQQVPEWDITATTTTTTRTSTEKVDFQYEDFGLHPADSVVPDPQTECDNSCWNIINSSTTVATAAGDDQNFHEMFEDLSNIQLEPSLQTQATPSKISSQKQFRCDFEKGESSGKQKTSTSVMETKSVLLSGDFLQKQDQRPKRTRAADLHNMSERKRRNRIMGKLRTLQELIPNCNKTDRASVLDDAIKYIKALKLQVQMMSMARVGLYQASNFSFPVIQSTQIPQFIPYLPMGPGLGASHAYGMGMGMVNMCYSAGLPIMPFPSPSRPPLQLSSAGLPLISAPSVLPLNPQLQMPAPFLASHVMPSAVTTSNVLQPQFATDFSQTFNYSNQGESTSQNNAKDAATDSQTVPTMSQISLSLKYLINECEKQFSEDEQWKKLMKLFENATSLCGDGYPCFEFSAVNADKPASTFDITNNKMVSSSLRTLVLEDFDIPEELKDMFISQYQKSWS